MARSSARRRVFIAAMFANGLAVRTASAQATAGRAKDAGFRADSLMVWASLALGPSVQSSHHQPIAANASIWATYHSTAVSIRSSGTSDLFEAGNNGDVSVLYGRRAPTKYVVIVGGIGVGISRAQGAYLAAPLPNETVFAVGAEADLSAPFAGIGLSAFGAFGQTRSFGGIGLTLALGRLR